MRKTREEEEEEEEEEEVIDPESQNSKSVDYWKEE